MRQRFDSRTRKQERIENYFPYVWKHRALLFYYSTFISLELQWTRI